MRIAILGGGVMGETLAAGLLQRMEERPDIVVAEKRPDRAAELQAALGVELADAPSAVEGADVVILVVKPQDMATLLSEVGPRVEPDAVVISIAAGISTATIEAALARGGHVVRAMPNTPALVGKAVTGVSGGASCRPEHVAAARGLLESVGMVVEVPEALQDAVTAVSGSGPAYLFYLAEAMLDAALALGLDEATARAMVTGTLDGAATLLATSDSSARELRAKVTSPNGTTAAATAVFDELGLGRVVEAGIQAARNRSRELS